MEALYQKDTLTQCRCRSGPVRDAQSPRSALVDAEEALRQRKRILAAMLNLPPDQADRLEVRGRSRTPGRPASGRRADPASRCNAGPTWPRSGWASTRPRRAYQLARANRFADAYLLYQPFTYPEQRPVRHAERDLLGAGDHRPAAGLQPEPGEHRAGPDQHLRSREVQLSDRSGGRSREVQQAIERVPGQRPDRRRDPRAGPAGAEAGHRGPREALSGRGSHDLRLLESAADVQR